jgi:hypothetical protein
MNCNPTDKENVRDRVKRKKSTFTTFSKSMEESYDRLKSLEKWITETFDDKTGERIRTYVDFVMNTSPSTIAQEKYGQDTENMSDKDKEKGEASRLVGDKVHDQMEKIVNDLVAKKKPSNISGLTDVQFQRLVETGKSIVNWAKAKQNAIDPSGEFRILTEQLVGSSSKNYTGKADLIVLLSNGKAVLFDYKTVRGKSFTAKKEVMDDDFFKGKKAQQYDLQLLEYAQMLERDYGIEILESFLVPIVTRFDQNNKLKDIRSYQGNTEADDNFLSFIPSSSSKTGTDNLDTLIKNLSLRIQGLKKRGSYKDKENAELLTKQYNSLNVDKDLSMVHNALSVIKGRYARLKKKGDFSLEDVEELRSLLEDASLYTDIEKVYNDILPYHTDPEKLQEEIAFLNARAESIKFAVENDINKLMTNNWFPEGSVEDGKFQLQRKLNLIARNFLGGNSIDNSFVKALMKVINLLTDKLSFTMREEKERILNIESAALKRVGSTKVLYNMLINKEKGRMHSIYSEAFKDKLDLIEKMEDSQEKAEEYQKLYELKDKDQFLQEFKEKEDRYKNWLEDHLTLSGYSKGAYYDKIYDSRLEAWRKSNNLVTNPKAWNNEYLRGKYTTLKPEVKETYLSEEFKKIQAIPEVLAYYGMWTDQMENIRKMLDIDYNEINNTFIPWFRKDMLDRLSDDIGSIPKDLFKDWTSMREGDIETLQYSTKDGHKKAMPLLGRYPLKNSKGEVDVKEKSYDLTKSLLMFTTSAYQAKFAREAEGHALSIKELHADKAQELYIKTTKEERDYRGKVVVDKLNSYYDMNSVLDKFIDRHIYGIHTEELIGKKADKLFSKVLDWNSKRLLGLAVAPAIAGGMAAGMQLDAIGKKNLYWNREQSKEADKLLVESLNKRLQGKTGKANKFVDIWDLLSESSIEKAIHEANPTMTKKWLNERSLYMFYRTSDEAVDMKISVAAAQNYGFDEFGNIKQKENLPKGTPSVWELFNYNEETGEYSLDKLGSDKTEIARKMGQFRRVVGAIQYRVKGTMPKGESAAYQQNLAYNAAMQFKSWMPGVMLERLETINYSEITDTVNVGRYTALKQYVDFTTEEVEFAKRVGTWANIAMHMFYKMLNRKHLLEDSPKSREALSASFGRLPQEIQDYFMKGSTEISVGEENYRAYLDKQMVAMANELRWILGSITSLLMMGMSYGTGGDEEEEIKDLNWGTRFSYRLIRKIGLEVRFAYNPFEIMSLNKGAFPVLGIMQDIGNFTGNTVDEARDFFFGENSSQDKSTAFHYLTLLIYGGRQFRQTADFIFEVDKKLPN